MNKYPKYKSSGVEWVGDIPENWELKKLKHITEYKNGVSFKSEDFSKEEKIPVIRIGEVGDIIDFDDCVKLPTSFLEKYSEFIIKKGDILIGLTGGTIGKSGRYNYDTPSLLNQRVCIIRNKMGLENKLLYYYVKSEVFIRYIFYNCYGGGQDNIGKEDIINMIFPYPPLPEQQQIVQFLDEKTDVIDKLISTKERKIELLKQQRTSLINEVITKGLNPKVKMKDSGVEWIGEIPEHWVVSRFKYVSEIVTGNTPSKMDGGEYYTEDDGFLWIKPTYLKGDKYVDDSDEKLTELGRQQTRVIPKESIMICCIGNTIGKYGMSNQDVSTNQQINSVIPNQSMIKSWYCLYFVDVFTRDLLNRSNFVTLPILTKSDLENIEVIVPPIKEQEQIVEHIESNTKEIDELVSMEQNKIDLLKEYRQSLISEVITGKIDVRTNPN
jgi:type I restriction enzyme S subunit